MISKKTANARQKQKGPERVGPLASIDDLIDVCERALSMTSSMVAQREGNV
jgi:hypothetical protein